MREFLARKQVPHQFRDVRRQPVGAAEALAIVRRAGFDEVALRELTGG